MKDNMLEKWGFVEMFGFFFYWSLCWFYGFYFYVTSSWKTSWGRQCLWVCFNGYCFGGCHHEKGLRVELYRKWGVGGGDEGLNDGGNWGVFSLGCHY